MSHFTHADVDSLIKRFGVVQTYIFSFALESPDLLHYILDCEVDGQPEKVKIQLLNEGIHNYLKYVNNHGVANKSEIDKIRFIVGTLKDYINESYQGTYPLINAIEAEDIPLLDILLENGASTDIQTGYVFKKSAAEYAKETDNKMIMDRLEFSEKFG